MNVYLIASSSKSLIKEEIAKIIKKAENIVYTDYLTEGMEFILEEAAYLSLFNDKKFLIVKNSNIFTSTKCKEGDLEKLEKYLLSPNPNTVVIFTLTEKLDERKKISKIIKEKYSLINIPVLNHKDLVKRIIELLKKDKLEISYENAVYIANSALNNYDLVINELDKIVLYYEEGAIVQEEVIQNLLAKNIEENIFRFSESVLKKDYQKMFAIFNDLKIVKQRPEILIGSLAREFRLSYKCSLLVDRGYSKEKIARELGMPDWMVDKYLRNSMGYRKDELLEKISDLANTDLIIKKGDMDKYLAIEMFLLSV